jgi:hypothetical protein
MRRDRPTGATQDLPRGDVPDRPSKAIGNRSFIRMCRNAHRLADMQRPSQPVDVRASEAEHGRSDRRDRCIMDLSEPFMQRLYRDRIVHDQY